MIPQVKPRVNGFSTPVLVPSGGALAFPPPEDYTARNMDERRQVPRYLAGLTAELTHHESGPVSQVAVEVLSVQGCCLQGTEIPGAGRKCQLTIRWQEEEIRTEAQVVWKNSKGWAGLRFLNMDRESSENLRELCATLGLQPFAPISADEG
ncbi:MAG: PilZ domain-containing protein [Acidobacteriia bacterium]|nr:PilZ domain-containing protein [Terriglobia bacterium]